MNAEEKIIKYGKELGIENANVDDFISSHRSLYEKSRVKQQLWESLVEEARTRAYQQVLDSSWIRLEDLKKMSVKELVEMLQED